jgi:phosphoribosylglycinamide formyltransferase-1
VTLRIGWFSTGRGQGSRDLLTAAVRAIEAGRLDAEIAFVFCNRERGEHEATDGFLDLVESFDIPVIALSSRQFRRDRGGALSEPDAPLPEWRTDYDREIAKLLETHPFDVGMLAGYMLIFTPEMAARHAFLNLHPAEPAGPIGTWQNVIWELIDARAERSGIMIHLATDELDRGPVVSYCIYQLHDAQIEKHWSEIAERSVAELQDDPGEDLALFREIRSRGAARELPFVIETLRAFAAGRLKIEGGQVLDGNGSPLQGGLDLTSEVEASMRDRATASAES